MTTTSFPRETLLMPAARPSGALRSLGLAVAFSLLIALGAQLKFQLPFTPVPLTAQTLMVLLCGALLGARWGAVAVGLYLLEGAAGLPFFQGGASGLAYLFSSFTTGYLLAFVVGASITGELCERGWDKSTGRAIAAMLVGTAVVYMGGWIGLLPFMAPGKAFAVGVLPFLLGDTVKVVLAAALLPVGWKLTRRTPR